MRHSIKRISKSALSVILALMMIVSTMAVGIITVSAFDLKGTYNFDNYTAKWDKVYLVKVGNDGKYTEYQEMTAESDGIYSCTLGSWDGSSFYFANSNSNPTAKTTGFTSAVKSTNNCFVPSSATGTSITGTWMTKEQAIENHSGSDEPTPVTDTNLLSVLKGVKVMFYGGEPSDWGATTFYVMTSNDTSKSVASGSMSGSNSLPTDSSKYKFTTLCAPVGTYYLGHWASNLSTTISAGMTYIIRNSTTTTSGYTYCSDNGTNYLYSYNNGATLTATTTCDPSIQAGSTLTVNTSSDKGKSTIGKDNSFKYYITFDNATFTEYTLTDGTLDTSSLADGTYTLKTVLTDGNIYVVGDTDTFTVSSKTDLAKPDVVVSNSNVVTSKANATITVTSSSGDSYPSDTTYTLLDASDNVVEGVTWNGKVATVEFTDLSSDNDNYKVKVSADEATYNPAVSDVFNLKKVQLYAVTLAENADAVVTGNYYDAYGVGQTIDEGQTADVPSGNTVHVNATDIDTANKAFSKFTYNGNDYPNNNTDITITTDGTISTVIDTVTYRTVKIAVIEYADKEHHGSDSNYLSTNDVTYTFGGTTKTTTMTAVAEDPTAYFVLSGKWSGNGNLYYIYEAQVPSTVTKINVGGVKEITLDDTTEFYGIYHFDSAWNVQNFNQSDRYYYVNVVADTTVDSGATVSATGSASVTNNSDSSMKLYKYQTTITLDATPSSAFSLERWNDGTNDIYSPYTVVGDATLTAYFKANQSYAITLVDTDANLESITSSPATSTYEGNTVKVTVTANPGYECTGLTVKTATDVDVTATKNTDGTYSFRMPGENVTVTPTITARKVATVNVTSSDETLGTAVLSTTVTIYVGDSFTVKATPLDDYVFESFSVTGADQISTVKNDDGSTTGTFKSNAQNVSVTANFTENSGELCDDKFLVYGNNKNNPTNWGISDGKHYIDVYYKDNAHYATIPREVFAADGNFYFALCGSKTEISDLWWTQGSAGTNGKDIKVTVNDTEKKIEAKRSDYGGYQTNKNAQFVEITRYDSSVIAINVKIEISSVDGATYNQGTYTLTPVVETLPEGTATVYAKDGTTVSGGTNHLGETKVTDGYYRVKSDVESETYRTYTALKDSYLTIQTTMDSSAVTNGYYVYAFCINGESYPAVAKKGGVYETTYKVTGEEVHNAVEITPVYYNTKIEKEGDYITVYVDASKLGNHWGNTISCYSYYYTGTYNKDGKPDAYETTKYPGQPMLLGSNGLYYTRVPRYAYSNGTKIEKSTGVYYPISGVTLNSFSESELHGTIYPEIGTNYQTYDYDDFKYIADLGFDTVKFEIQYKTGTTNRSTLISDATNHPDKSGSTIDISDYEVSNEHNGWDNFYDFDGNIIGILGKKLNPTEQAQTPIYVVSTGNQNTSMGQWSTVWYVYRYDENSGKYTYVTQGLPSDFIPRMENEEGIATNKPAYQAIVSAGLENVPVKICYESEQGADGNTGVRIDGRWYYTTSTQDAPVDVTVQYTNDINTGVWTIDTTGISGTATIDGVTSKTFTERNVTAKLDAVAKSGYVFAEWGTVDDNGENYTKLSNIKSASAEFMIDTSYHLVARFEKVEDGSLVITHKKYTGPDYIGGGGYYYVSAVVYNSDGTVNSTYDLTEGSITIPELASLKDSNCTIKITMVTKMKGDNKFIDWYMLTPEGDYDNITQDEAVWGATGEVSQEVTVAVNDLYSGSELVVNTLQYYSDIAKVTKDAVLNYKYYNRFGEKRTYTVTVTLNDTYIEENGYSITNQLIYDNAPAIEDLYKDCIWTITDQSTTKNGTTATIWGTHNEVTYKVKLNDLINAEVRATVKYNEYLKNPNTDAFYTAPAEKDGVSFAYWLVEENDKEVARCYANEFNLKILGNYTITAVYANEKDSSLSIVGPTYTREQFNDDAGNVKSDYLYVDFIVAYMNSYGILLNGDLAKDMDYHTGLIIEFDRNIKVTDVDAENAKLSKPLTDYAYDNYSGIEDIAKNSDKTSGSLTVDGNRALYKFEIDNAGYNNKNRLDYYVKFNNTKSFRHYVMKAYYYVYYTDPKTGKTIYNQTLPVYFCLFEIGNSTADLS